VVRHLRDRQRAKQLYGNVSIHRLLDDKATARDIKETLTATIAAKARPQDTLVVFVSGHGFTVGQRYYFLPHEFEKKATKFEDDIRKHGIPSDVLGDWISSVKGRDSKPLAVMLDHRFLNDLPVSDRRPIDGPANLIVLVPSSCIEGIAENASPGLDTVGVMRPTTPLHWALLEEFAAPLVVTSGNVEGEPLAYQNRPAHENLPAVADVILHHDRPIVRPIDDSVVRVVANRPVTIRCARGIAPSPLALDGGCPLLAAGGHQQVAVAVCNGEQSVLGPHIGDLDSVAARERFVDQTKRLMELYGVKPVAIVHDLHPDYFTTQWAGQQDLPTIAVQHHHAHIVSGMLEHRWLDRKVPGVAFDGTGYGTDGTIWGGEFLLAAVSEFQRVGTLRPFLLPGGERAIREPWRIGLALFADACGIEQAVRIMLRVVEPARLTPCVRLIEQRIGPMTTSMGRLFDAIAALILSICNVSYEGEAAMRLEAAGDLSATGEYELPLCEMESLVQLDWRPLLRDLRDDLARDVPAGTMAIKFHRAVAAAVFQMASRFADYPVVLSGGCFQNRILTEMIAERLSNQPQPVGLPGVIPPNDGGLAAGQLVIAQLRLQSKDDRCA